MSRRRAISALLIPDSYSFQICPAFFAAVSGRPKCFPFSLASAMPARIRSRRISCSNSANTESNPAMARPVGVVRSNTSVSDTKPTPSSESSFSVTTRSTSDRPHRSSRQRIDALPAVDGVYRNPDAQLRRDLDQEADSTNSRLSVARYEAEAPFSWIRSFPLRPSTSSVHSGTDCTSGVTNSTKAGCCGTAPVAGMRRFRSHD
jgi:hypothetical protein